MRIIKKLGMDYCIIKKSFIFATVKAHHSYECLTGDKDFKSPSGGASARQTRKGLLFLYPCVDGIINASAQVLKPATGGRNTAGKCSPKERSTLPRRPKLQKYLSRLTSAVLCEDFRDGIQSSQAKCGKVQRTNLPFSISTDFRTSKQH